jgi:hypothetical protein
MPSLTRFFLFIIVSMVSLGFGVAAIHTLFVDATWLVRIHRHSEAPVVFLYSQHAGEWVPLEFIPIEVISKIPHGYIQDRNTFGLNVSVIRQEKRADGRSFAMKIPKWTYDLRICLIREETFDLLVDRRSTLNDFCWAPGLISNCFRAAPGWSSEVVVKQVSIIENTGFVRGRDCNDVPVPESFSLSTSLGYPLAESNNTFVSVVWSSDFEERIVCDGCSYLNRFRRIFSDHYLLPFLRTVWNTFLGFLPQNIGLVLLMYLYNKFYGPELPMPGTTRQPLDEPRRKMIKNK